MNNSNNSAVDIDEVVMRNKTLGTLMWLSGTSRFQGTGFVWLGFESDLWVLEYVLRKVIGGFMLLLRASRMGTNIYVDICMTSIICYLYGSEASPR